MTRKSTTKQDDLLTNAKFWNLLSILCGNHDDTCHLAGRPAYSDHGLIVSLAWARPVRLVSVLPSRWDETAIEVFLRSHQNFYLPKFDNSRWRPFWAFSMSKWANNNPSRIKFGRGIKENYTFFARALVRATIPGNKLFEHFYLARIFLFLFFHAIRHELKERNGYFP